MAEHSLLFREVQERLDGFLCRLLGKKAGQVLSLASKSILRIVKVTFCLF
ncbi:hypothetical protein MBBA_0140 [Methanoculleus bourgensis]|jgi:hypothetical protein|nr:hypothetical protein MBBA_0140 [Methanoculleus bourgensis]